MVFSQQQKEELKRDMVRCLSSEKEIKRIVIFGSFLTSPEPHDMDVAIFQDSNEKYLPLAMKYRRKVRTIARKLPMDIFPVKPNATTGHFMDEISQGEIIYER